MISTTLLEGKIQLNTGTGMQLMAPGEQLIIYNDKSRQLLHDADIDEAIAWKEGYFHFSHADLNTVLRQISRWYDLDVDCRISATACIYNGEIDITAGQPGSQVSLVIYADANQPVGAARRTGGVQVQVKELRPCRSAATQIHTLDAHCVRSLNPSCIYVNRCSTRCGRQLEIIRVHPDDVIGPSAHQTSNRREAWRSEVMLGLRSRVSRIDRNGRSEHSVCG